MDDHTRFSEEELKSQDGNKIPLKAFPGGPVIGEAVLRYDPENKILVAKMHVDDPDMAKILGENPSSIIFRQGE